MLMIDMRLIVDPIVVDFALSTRGEEDLNGYYKVDWTNITK